jgi:hypothetical protein
MRRHAYALGEITIEIELTPWCEDCALNQNVKPRA